MPASSVADWVIGQTTSTKSLIRILYRGVVLPIVMEHHAPIAGFGPYLIRAAGPGLWNAAKDLLFEANARSCGTELLRPRTFASAGKQKQRERAVRTGSPLRLPEKTLQQLPGSRSNCETPKQQYADRPWKTVIKVTTLGVRAFRRSRALSGLVHELG
jgi:hypothetical protein